MNSTRTKENKLRAKLVRSFMVAAIAVFFMGGAIFTPIPGVMNGPGPAVAQDSESVALPSLAELAEKLKPAVVNISTTKVVTGGGYPFTSPFKGSPFERFFGDEDFFRRFFGDQHGREFKQRSLGS